MKLNTSKVIAREAEKQGKPKPLPVIKMGVTSVRSPKPVVLVPSEKITAVSENININSEAVIQLTAELAALQRQRGKLSSQTAYLVADIEKKLRVESNGLADEFLNGNLPMAELAEHASKINALTMQASILWDQIRHAEKYGTPPPVAEPAQADISSHESEAAKVIIYEIRRLDDMIYKTGKKIKGSTTSLGNKKNSGDWLMKWKQKLAMAETQREQLKIKLKRIQKMSDKEHSALVPADYAELPREANRTKDSTFDRIYKYYHNNKSRIELTTDETVIRERWEKAWLLLCRHRTAKQVADLLEHLYKIKKSTAFDDVRFAQMLFSNPNDDLKEARRAIQLQGLQAGADKAWKKGDLEMHLKYMKEINELGDLKTHNDANDMSELIKKLKPHTIVIMATPVELENEARKLQEDLIHDIDFEDAGE